MNIIQKSIPDAWSACLIFILLGINTFAQEPIEVKNIRAQMSKGTQPCYVVNIPHAEIKSCQKDWIKKLRENNKIKIKEINLELVMEGALKSELTTDSVNIYSLMVPKDSLISLYLFLEIDSVFFSPKEDKTDLVSDKIDNSIKNYMRSFAVDQYNLVVSDELEDQQKMLKTLQNDLEKLVKDEENMKKDSASLENDIEQKERDIKELDANIEFISQELLKHNASMLTLSTDIEKDVAKDRKKELEKMKKDEEKSRSKTQNDIISYRSKIEKHAKDILKGEEMQEKKKQEISDQNTIINSVQTKLDGMK